MEYQLKLEDRMPMCEEVHVFVRESHLFEYDPEFKPIVMSAEESGALMAYQLALARMIEQAIGVPALRLG